MSIQTLLRPKHLLVGLSLFLSASCLAQNVEKLSPSTQLFLLDRASSAGVAPSMSVPRSVPSAPRVERVSAFIGLRDNDDSGLAPLGVDIDTRFDGFVTALLPADSLLRVAALDNVSFLEVAEALETTTDLARTDTRAADVLQLSAEARRAGLRQPYDGRGVLLAVIDRGIDFQHRAFCTEQGVSRIVRAYTVESGKLTAHTTPEEIALLDTDYTAGSHGTHCASIAAGSDVTVGSTTYGGMAPAASLVLAGLGSSLTTTLMASAIKSISDYADEQQMPCVISVSTGSFTGPRDGSGTLARAVAQCVGEGRVVVWSTGNEAGKASGGAYAYGRATRAHPLNIVLGCHSSREGHGSLYNMTAAAWARTPQVPLAMKLHVLNRATGRVVWTSDEVTTTKAMASTVSKYYQGDGARLQVVRSAASVDNGKSLVQLSLQNLLATDLSASSTTGTSNYELAVSLYPVDASQETLIDCWTSGNGYFTHHADVGTYHFAAGSDSCSVSNEAVMPGVVSVGAYITRNAYTDCVGNTYSYTADITTLGSHMATSSWAAPGYGPLATSCPTVAAPGAQIVAAVNHLENGRSGADMSPDIDNPYGVKSGTSMAAPCVAGIVALWLQADPTLTPDRIATLAAATCRHDSFTDGADAGPYGLGKIDALAGLRQLLPVLPGDANGDGQVSLADVTTVVNYVLGQASEPFVPDNADVNADGHITLDDVTAIVNILLGQ